MWRMRLSFCRLRFGDAVYPEMPVRSFRQTYIVWLSFRPVFVNCEVSKTDVGSSLVEVREKRVSIHFRLDSDNVRYRI